MIGKLIMYTTERMSSGSVVSKKRTLSGVTRRFLSFLKTTFSERLWRIRFVEDVDGGHFDALVTSVGTSVTWKTYLHNSKPTSYI